MEPSFWSWEKPIQAINSIHVIDGPQWSPAFGAGKSLTNARKARMSSNPQWSPALGAGKSRRPRWSLCTVLCRNGAQLLELGKGGFPWLWSSPGRSRNGAQLLELGKGRPHSWLRGLIQPQWSPAFGAGKRSRSMPFLRVTEMAAMEPSFWSWEKPFHDSVAEEQQPCRNGAQLLELGKATPRVLATCCRYWPQWSPAFGAGKSNP